MKCTQHYLTDMQEIILFYNGLDVPARQILDSKGAIPTKTAANAKVAIQETAEYSQKWHNGTSRTRKTRGELKHNQRRFDLLPDAKLSEIKGASIKTLEIQIGQMSKVLQERGLKSTQLDGNEPKGSCQIILTAKAISNGYVVSDQAHKPVADSQIRNVFSETVLFPRPLHDYCCDEWKEARELKILETYSIRTTLHDDTLPQKEKDTGSFTLPCFIHNVCFDKALVDLGASVSVMLFSTYTNLSV
ncbi:hypothetical protein Tco_1093927 [Tanacetum coccineum]|uniref:Uncharacterized protein n=1 Tax=Tanacetum coccineum TaxID=301880 RepID=A0ABQ5IE47_9ASTR